MTHRQRLEAVFAGVTPDRPPIMGGWISSPGLYMKATGATAEEYKADPQRVALDTYRKFGTDVLIGIMTTQSDENYRIVSKESYSKADIGQTFEEAEAKVEALESAVEYERAFDFDKAYADFKKHMIDMQATCGDMVFMPAQWGAGAVASWYGEYGYENFFLLVGLRPDLAAKLFQRGGAIGRCRGKVIAKGIKEGLYPKAVLLGEDICTQRGSMISVKFLEEHYEPALAYGLEPLLEVGCRPVWHCDGNVNELLPLLLRSGIQGFQGFQPECDMRVEEIVKLRTREGNKLLIFGPMSVTTELPVFSPEQMRQRVRDVVEVCKDQADIVFFTANTINPDVPFETLDAMYDEIRKYRYV